MKANLKIYNRIGDLRNLTKASFKATVAIYVDGFLDDAATCIIALKSNSDSDIAIYVLVSGDLDITVLEPLLDDRTFIVKITEGVGWGEANNALLKLANSTAVIFMDPSTIFQGDAISPALEKIANLEFCAAGWRGGLVNIEDEWRSIDDKGVGEVDVLFGYFMAVNRDAALEVGGFNSRAIYYRNADMEFSLKLRQAQGKLWQMDLPLEQARHHGYYDADPEYRESQSKKTYDRILDRFRGKNEILVARR
jgi:GT2 family glycosyltransferase